MAPKKAKGKAKGKKSKRKANKSKGKDNNDAAPAMPIILSSTDEWVTLDLKLLNWKFLDFKYRTRTATHIFTIKKLLFERHGRITELTLCEGAFTEANELTDEMKTLKCYGIKGAPRETEPHVTIPIFYDFKPLSYDEPLLLVEPKVWGDR